MSKAKEQFYKTTAQYFLSNNENNTQPKNSHSKSEIKKIQTNNIAIDKDSSVKSIEDGNKESVETNNENNNNPLRDVF